MFHISGEHLLLGGGGIQLLEVRVAGGSRDWLPETNQFPSFSLFFNCFRGSLRKVFFLYLDPCFWDPVGFTLESANMKHQSKSWR